MKKETKEVYMIVLKIAKEIAKEKAGALFVIGNKKKLKGKYQLLYPKILKGNVKEKGIEKVLRKLATLDGAVLLDENGDIIAYGARIKKSISIKGFGTRHAAAAGITTFPNVTAILVSEEIGWIKIFKNGKIVLETDAEGIPKRAEEKIVSYISTGDKTFIAGLVGAGAAAIIVGSPIIAPIAIIGGTYIIAKTATKMIKRKLKR